MALESNTYQSSMLKLTLQNISFPSASFFLAQNKTKNILTSVGILLYIKIFFLFFVVRLFQILLQNLYSAQYMYKYICITLCFFCIVVQYFCILQSILSWFYFVHITRGTTIAVLLHSSADDSFWFYCFSKRHKFISTNIV